MGERCKYQKTTKRCLRFYVTSEITDLGRKYPPARQVLMERRDARERVLRASSRLVEAEEVERAKKLAGRVPAPRN